MESDILIAAEQAFCLLVGMIENGKVHPHEVRNTMQKLEKAILAERTALPPARKEDQP